MNEIRVQTRGRSTEKLSGSAAGVFWGIIALDKPLESPPIQFIYRLRRKSPDRVEWEKYLPLPLLVKSEISSDGYFNYPLFFGVKCNKSCTNEV